jgi:hypothetical protein
MGSLNVDQNYPEPTKESNMLLLNTLKNIVNAFGTINWVTKKGWPQIPRWQDDEKLIKTSSNNGNNDQLLERKLFRTTLNLNLVNTKTLSIQQPTTVTIVMNVNPLMAIIHVNVLRIKLPKYHDNDGHVIHIRQLTKVCVINGEDIDDHKLQYFSNFIKRRAPD